MFEDSPEIVALCIPPVEFSLTECTDECVVEDLIACEHFRKSVADTSPEAYLWLKRQIMEIRESPTNTPDMNAPQLADSVADNLRRSILNTLLDREVEQETPLHPLSVFALLEADLDDDDYEMLMTFIADMYGLYDLVYYCALTNLRVYKFALNLLRNYTLCEETYALVVDRVSGIRHEGLWLTCVERREEATSLHDGVALLMASCYMNHWELGFVRLRQHVTVSPTIIAKIEFFFSLMCNGCVCRALMNTYLTIHMTKHLSPLRLRRLQFTPTCDFCINKNDDDEKPVRAKRQTSAKRKAGTLTEITSATLPDTSAVLNVQ